MPDQPASTPTRISSRLTARDCWMLLAIGCVLIGGIGLYVSSGPASAGQLLAQLTHDEQHLPPFQSLSKRDLSTLIATPAPPALPAWSGAGKHYLKQLWPALHQQQDAEQLLSLIAIEAVSPAILAYRQFPNEYVLTLDPKHYNVQIWLKREGFSQWQPYLVCSDAGSTQPLLDLKHCPSDKR